MRRLFVAIVLALVIVSTAAAATAPIVASGTGTDVVDVTLSAGTIVVSSTHQGESNFIVYLVGPSGADELVANVIGNAHDEKVVEGLRAGNYRLSVDADGPWTIRITYPKAGGRQLVPSSFSGDGPKVIKVRLRAPARPVINASNDGDSNFFVYIIRLGRTAERDLLVNEIGPGSWRTLAPQLAAGSYLLEIEAVGRWSLTFRR